MRTCDLMLFVAHDLLNGVSNKDICSSWDISLNTLNRWKKDPQFKSCMERAEEHRLSHIPVLFPTELRNLGVL